MSELKFSWLDSEAADADMLNSRKVSGEGIEEVKDDADNSLIDVISSINADNGIVNEDSYDSAEEERLNKKLSEKERKRAEYLRIRAQKEKEEKERREQEKLQEKREKAERMQELAGRNPLFKVFVSGVNAVEELSEKKKDEKVAAAFNKEPVEGKEKKESITDVLKKSLFSKFKKPNDSEDNTSEPVKPKKPKKNLEPKKTSAFFDELGNKFKAKAEKEKKEKQKVKTNKEKVNDKKEKDAIKEESTTVSDATPDTTDVAETEPVEKD